MQPSKKEIEGLRGLVRWARTPEADAQLRINCLADALDRAILALEERHDSVTEMLLLGVWQAMIPMHGNQWDIVDMELIDFVGRELIKRYGNNPGAPRPEPPKGAFG